MNDYAVVQNMQRDRVVGNYTDMSFDQQMAEIAQMGPANAAAPLPMSPCIRVKATGEIHEWSSFFAARPDLCECCDEHGNTDPAAWQGRKSTGVDDSGQPTRDMYGQSRGVPQQAQPQPAPQPKPAAQPQPKPRDLPFYFDLVGEVSEPGVPDVAMASQKLGVPQNFSKSYSDSGVTKQTCALYDVPANHAIGEAVQGFAGQF